VKSTKNIVIVTGASSGIGRTIADKLRKEGHCVYGTSRSPTNENNKANRLYELNVCSPESVTNLVAAVLKKEGRIDVLVNNAGFASIGPAEETTLEQAKQQFETNFFGVVSMINAVLPTMRAQRSGQVINISSLGGLTGIPFQALYSASKHAVEGYVESLSWELKTFGINLHLIEPGFINTGLKEHLSEGVNHIKDYESMRAIPMSVIKKQIGKGADPELVASAVSKIISGRRASFRMRIGQDARWVPILKKFIPHSLYSKAIANKFGLPRTKHPISKGNVEL
jgi:NAD(P)-dependent dehydrogenase (short-subunit alcohol dehydrogenase family)